MFQSFMFIFSICRVQVGEGVISDLLNPGVTMGWAVSKTFGYESVNEVLKGLNIKSVISVVILLGFALKVEAILTFKWPIFACANK
jgi:hypothetical protein